TYFSQKMMMTDPKQAKLMAIMPLIMFVFSLKMAAGVLLYWATQQVLSMVQQMAIMKTNTPSKKELAT
ncbi:MAG: YidC/Oxa1 family membrane protein insertase, partial [Candidatus Marinamargulisbacteria bacterium]